MDAGADVGSDEANIGDRARVPERRLRILYVVEATFAGTGRHVLDVMRGMLEREHEVHLAYSPTRMEPRFAAEMAELESLGLKTVAIPMARSPGPSDVGAIRSVRRYVRDRGGFDVLHGHSSKGGAVARLAGVGLGIPRVYTPHAFITMDPDLAPRARIIYRTVEAFLGRFASEAVIAVSPEEYDHALLMGLPKGKCVMIQNAIRLPDNVPSRAVARLQFGLDDNDLVLSFVGRFSRQKAPEKFVELVRGLVPEFPNLKALMLGYGELEGDVRDRIKALDLQDRVTLYSDRRGVDAMAAANVHVLTSTYETTPTVLLEAVSIGLPMVTTRVGGCVRAVEDGVNGFVVEQDDAGALLAAVRRLCEDADLRARMAAASRERAKLFDLDANIERKETVYLEIASVATPAS